MKFTAIIVFFPYSRKYLLKLDIKNDINPENQHVNSANRSYIQTGSGRILKRSKRTGGKG